MPKTTSAIPLKTVWHAQQRAQLRLQLYVTGETHRILNEFATNARGIILVSAGGKKKTLDGLGLYRAVNALGHEWSKAFETWKGLFNTVRRDSAALAFETLLIYHERMVIPALEKSGVTASSQRKLSWYWWSANESRQQTEFTEANLADDVSFVFEPQLRAVMDAADQLIHHDGVRLSQRIWKLNHDAQSGINAVLYNGVARSKSAWDIAKDLEAYLGANQDCPRWTKTRLYRLTKGDIAAGDPRGLLRASECDGRGVAYNALRVARTELQAIHNLATQDVMARMPWVEKEQVNLSKAHPKRDICDEVIEKGEGGKGIYPKGTIRLPLHPNCLCFLTAVQQSPDEFAKRVRAWVRGGKSDPALDQYMRMMQNVTSVMRAVNTIA